MNTDNRQLIPNMFEAAYKAVSKEIPSGLTDQLEDVLLLEGGFLNQVKTLDSICKTNHIESNINEMLFDILLFNFFSMNGDKLDESYFESAEWNRIEEATIDRGTELMNLLLYLQECSDIDIPYSLDDYLDEYLVADEDFNQEDYEVYEPIIKNREILDKPDEATLIEVCKKNAETPLDEQLLPILLFFGSHFSNEKKFNIIASNGSDPAFQSAFLAVLINFTS
jgi:hypothetical protein